MKSTTLRLLADPLSGEPLNLEKDPTGTEWLSAPNTGGRYPIRDGMPIFISTADISGENAKYQKLYDRLAPFYDLSVRGYAWLRGHSERDRLTEYLQELEIHPGDQVLETSIGTGRNVHYLPPEAQYYGVDISWGMLQRCRRSAPGWNRDVELFQCGAEKLCFHDEAFDVVFHVGGINFFNDRRAAIREMLRVAKPGAKLIIVTRPKSWPNTPQPFQEPARFTTAVRGRSPRQSTCCCPRRPTCSVVKSPAVTCTA